METRDEQVNLESEEQNFFSRYDASNKKGYNTIQTPLKVSREVSPVYPSSDVDQMAETRPLKQKRSTLFGCSEGSTRFNEQLRCFSGERDMISKSDVKRVNPKVEEVYKILMNPNDRSEMLEKGVIRPDLKDWNREKFSKADLEREVKLRTTSNLGIPLLPVHKMCRTEKNKIHDIMHRDPPKAPESQYKDIKVMLPLLKNPESPRYPETLERSVDKFGLGSHSQTDSKFKQTSALLFAMKPLNTSAQLTSVSIRSQSPRPFLSPA